MIQQLNKLVLAIILALLVAAQAKAVVVDTVTTIPYHNSSSDLALNSVSNDEYRFDLAGLTSSNFVVNLTNMSLTNRKQPGEVIHL